ncbi:MAG: pyrroloquinoline quinone precursor peptide PqqA [Alphaproteobacteria bacterium]
MGLNCLAKTIFFRKNEASDTVIHQKDMQMAWRKPKITEISVGMEINCYACAEIAA